MIPTVADKSSVPLCWNCSFCERRSAGPENYRCLHPTAFIGYSVIDGADVWKKVVELRSDESSCGTRAKFFATRDPLKDKTVWDKDYRPAPKGKKLSRITLDDL